MRQTYYSHDAGEGFGFAMAISLANTWDIWFPDPERLSTTLALEEFLRDHGWEPPPSIEEQNLTGVRQLRSELRRIFASESASEAATLLMDSLAGLVVVPRLMVDEPSVGEVAIGFGPRPHADLLEQVRVVVGLGLAGALEHWGLARFRICDAGRCQDVFVDTSKNGRRRYCGVKCQNRVNVAALRERTVRAQQEQQ